MSGVETVAKYGGVLWTGTVTTVQLSFFALLIGSILGIVIGLLRSSHRRLGRWPATIYVELFRSIPVLLVLFVIYYGLPLVFRFELPPYPAAITALSLYSSAYMAEVVKTGVESVSRAQWDASYALGLRHVATLRHVILPQALRVSLPPAINVYIFTVKDSSVVSVIGYLELTGSGVAIRESDFGASSFAVLLAVATIYLGISYSLSVAGQLLGRRNPI